MFKEDSLKYFNGNSVQFLADWKINKYYLKIMYLEIEEGRLNNASSFAIVIRLTIGM